MSKAGYGLTSWDDIELGTNNPMNNKDLFLKLDGGSNIVRVLTNPFAYEVHTYKEEGDPGFGQRVLCSKEHGQCPLCDIGNKSKKRWYLGVIDRKTQTYKLLDIGGAVCNGIQVLSRDEEYGAPIKYDIDIKVNKNGGPTNYYNVVPRPPRPLSDADITLKSKVDIEDLQRRCSPPTPSQVVARLEAISKNRKAKLEQNGQSAPTTSKQNVERNTDPAPVKKQSSPSTDEDDEYTFSAE